MRAILCSATLLALWNLPISAYAKPNSVDAAPLSETRQACPGPIDYREIWTAADLQAITNDMLANNTPQLKYRQCSDIELSADGTMPIGHHADGRIAVGGFRGEYLGQGFRISGLRPVQGFSSVFGLFRDLNGARVSNLEINGATYVGDYRAGLLASSIDGASLENIKIIDSAIRSTSTDSGAIAGVISNSALDSITVNATLGTIGGLARSISDSTLENSTITLARDPLSNFSKFAGIAENFHGSQADRITISIDAASSLSLEEIAGFGLETRHSLLRNIIHSSSHLPHASSRAAGIASKALVGTIIENTRVLTSLSADWQAGGIAARSEGATIRDSFFIGNIQSGWAAGGIVGSGSIGISSAGAIVTSIERCAVRHSQITGPGPVGGIVGELYSSGLGRSAVADSYVLAEIHNELLSTDYSNLGGIAGLPFGSLLNRVLFSGSIAGGEYVGGITGVPFLDSTVQSAIYNSDLFADSNGEGTPAPQSAMMQDASLYSFFDLVQTWSFSPGSYPSLRSINALLVDVNGDFDVTNADLFEFLALYFGASQYADFDGSGTVAVTDIFAYLNAWFEGF